MDIQRILIAVCMEQEFQKSASDLSSQTYDKATKSSKATQDDATKKLKSTQSTAAKQLEALRKEAEAKYLEAQAQWEKATGTHKTTAQAQWDKVLS